MTTTTIVDPVGREEIAARLNVTRNTVDSWRTRGRGYSDRSRARPFPEPDDTISGTPLWQWSRVKAWAEETGRLKETT